MKLQVDRAIFYFEQTLAEDHNPELDREHCRSLIDGCRQRELVIETLESKLESITVIASMAKKLLEV